MDEIPKTTKNSVKEVSKVSIKNRLFSFNRTSILIYRKYHWLQLVCSLVGGTQMPLKRCAIRIIILALSCLLIRFL